MEDRDNQLAVNSQTQMNSRNLFMQFFPDALCHQLGSGYRVFFTPIGGSGPGDVYYCQAASSPSKAWRVAWWNFSQSILHNAQEYYAIQSAYAEANKHGITLHHRTLNGTKAALYNWDYVKLFHHDWWTGIYRLSSCSSRSSCSVLDLMVDDDVS